MSKTIEINIADKQAQLVGTPVIVCNNDDYTVKFTFDTEWAEHTAKTARFVYTRAGKVTHQDMPFTGDTAEVPPLGGITEVYIGVFAGDLITTTPAKVDCKPSILCISGEAETPSVDVYNQVMSLFNIRVLDPCTTIDFLQDHRNLLEGAEIYTDENGNPTSYTINSNGEIVPDTIYTNSAIYGPADVKPNTLYSTTATIVALAEYKEDGTFVALNWTHTKVGNMRQFITSGGCHKIKLVTKCGKGTRYEKDLCLFEGAYTERPKHQGHTHMTNTVVGEENIYPGSIAPEKVAYRAIQEEHCAFIETNKNYLRDVEWTEGFYTAYGAFTESETWCNSSFVPVHPATKYKLGLTANVSALTFDRNKVPCGTNELGTIDITTGEFTTPEDCYYVVINALPANISKMSMYLASADTTQANTFTMPALRVGRDNLVGEVLSAVKAPMESILADLIFATETKSIKLIGDSITHGIGSSDFAVGTETSDFLYCVYSTDCYRNYGVKCWAGQLKAYLESKFSCTVTNNGASGSKVEHLVANWDSIVSPDDDIIICMIGTNDRNNSLATIYQGIVALYERAQANGQRIIFMSAPPTSVANEQQFTACHMEDIDNLYNYVNSTLNAGYISIYKKFLNYCREHNIEVDTLLADGIHPNDTGYNLMFEIVLEALGFGRKRDGATW